MDKGEINLSKVVTNAEFAAIIKIVKSRQEFFARIAKDREESNGKIIGITDENTYGMDDKSFEGLKNLTEKVLLAADKRFYKEYKEELDSQPEIVEFLTKFSERNEKIVNYRDLFKA
jgi:hypothetical protein